MAGPYSRMMVWPPVITFSHGPEGCEPRWPAIRGLQTGAGNPIEIWRAAGSGFNWPTFVVLSTGTISVDVQGHIGPMLGDGSLDETMWFTFQSYNMTAGTAQTITCPTAYGWVRSKITSRSNGELFTGVGPICIAPGQVVKAQYPTVFAGGQG